MMHDGRRAARAAVRSKKCWFSHAIGGFFRERRDPAGIVARQEAAQTTRFSDASSSRMQIRKIKVSVEHNLNRLSSFPLRFSALYSKLFLGTEWGNSDDFSNIFISTRNFVLLDLIF